MKPVLLTIVCALPLCAADPGYAIRDLAYFGGKYATATAINDRGQVVVTTHPYGSGVYTTWLVEGRRVTQLPLGTQGAGINNRGQVVGTFTANQVNLAFVWEDGDLTRLGTLGGTHSGAAAINDHGEIVGYADVAVGGPRAALWERRGGVKELGPFSSVPAQWEPSFATAINGRGQVVGYSLANGWNPRAFLWENGVYRSLVTPENPELTATGIDNHGNIVGYSRIANCGTVNQAFAFFEKRSALAFLPVPYAARPRAINNHGQIAGELWVSTFSCMGDRRAFVLDGGKLTILPPLTGGTESIAYGLNDRGDVAGQSHAPDGWHAVVWNRR
jgi:probable HAF family extracellular repeat protein